jgi:hypothetical protein
MPEARCETAIAVEAVVAISRNDGNFYRIVTTVARGELLDSSGKQVESVPTSE